ncbi:MAG: tRNA (adenosine(37)-N6)-dimethylallyltransferase MiaA, partial [Anaerolineales bacterium]|nr:tRNA (adenosine(37)-N6)-dimethylallyltransferase MiaA [Anaerolineales bacterium]
GYRQIGACLRGEIDLPQATRMIKRASRRLVRKQAAWFRSEDARIHWYDLSEAALLAMKKDIAAWLGERQAAARA